MAVISRGGWWFVSRQGLFIPHSVLRKRRLVFLVFIESVPGNVTPAADTNGDMRIADKGEFSSFLG